MDVPAHTTLAFFARQRDRDDHLDRARALLERAIRQRHTDGMLDAAADIAELERAQHPATTHELVEDHPYDPASPIGELVAALSLLPTEADLVAVLLACETDPVAARLAAIAAGDAMTVDALFEIVYRPRVLAAGHAAVLLHADLAPDGPARRLGFLLVDGAGRFLAQTVRLHPRLTAWLLDRRGLDGELAGRARLYAPEPLALEPAAAVVDAVARAFAAGPQLVALRGPTGAGRELAVRAAALRLQSPALIVDAAGLDADGVIAAFREATLHRALLALRGADRVDPATGLATGSTTAPATGPASGRATGPATRPATGSATRPATGSATGPATEPPTRAAAGPATGPATADALRRCLEVYPGTVALIDAVARPGVVAGRTVVEVTVGVPPHAERVRLWRAELARDAALSDAEWDAVARYRLGAGGIAEVAELARRAAPALSAAAIADAVRRRFHPELAAVGRRVDELATWDDLVLPADTLARLAELVDRVALADQVRGWGFADRPGLVAWFTGPPGTGKSTAAAALAHRLGLALYAIDAREPIELAAAEVGHALVLLRDPCPAAIAQLAQFSGIAIVETTTPAAALGHETIGLPFPDAAARAEAIASPFPDAAAIASRSPEAAARAETIASAFRDARARVEATASPFPDAAARFEAAASPFPDAAARFEAIASQFPDAAARFETIVFPFPDAAARAALWQRAIPAAAPVGSVDHGALGARFSLSGRAIRDAALRAAYAAARAGEPIGMAHLERAASAAAVRSGR